jgi:hypothetical protein
VKRPAWIASLAVVAALGAASVADAQPKPSAAPSASAATSAAPSGAPAASASAAPSASPSADAAPSAAPGAGGALPPGHPSTGGAGGANRAHAGQDPRFFTPPEDTAVDDPTLAKGVISVTIKDATDKPIPRAPVVLSILHSTVAKGDSRERRNAVADENGVAAFEGLSFGSGHSYRIVTTRGGATYGIPAVGLTDRAGKRVVLHAYETSPDVDKLTVAMQGLFYISLRDDSIQIEQLLNVYNLGAISWIADAPFDLPEGFKAFNKQDSAEDARVEEVPGKGAALKGTFQPGRHDIDFRYQIPLGSEHTQTFKVRLPPRVAMSRVIMEGSKTMGLAVKDFPAAQRVTGRDGKRLLVTERQGTRAEGGIREVEITVSGLPTRPGRWVALAFAVIALVGGLLYFVQHRGASIDDDTRGDLVEAREALLGEIVALERAHKSGEIGPKTYARVRASLLDALARIVTMLDEAKPKKSSESKATRRKKAEPA